MSFNTGRVRGGTEAGKRFRTVKLQDANRAEWICACELPSEASHPSYGKHGEPLGVHDVTVAAPKVNPGWLVNCTYCGMRRP